MFESLSERLGGVFDRLTKAGLGGDGAGGEIFAAVEEGEAAVGG